MSKWVNADYINDFFDKWEERVKNAEPITIDVVRNVRSIMNETPTIDIVHCKDCKYSRVYALDSNSEPQRWCVVGIVKAVDDDDYCSWGRVEGE